MTFDHVALVSENIKRAIEWYVEKWNAEIIYQDETWAMLNYDNISLALVLPKMHPPHIAFEKINAEDYGKLTPHRDGTSSVYIKDPSDNAVEILKKS